MTPPTKFLTASASELFALAKTDGLTWPSTLVALRDEVAREVREECADTELWYGECVKAQARAEAAERERDAAVQSARDAESASLAYHRSSEEWQRRYNAERAKTADAKREGALPEWDFPLDMPDDEAQLCIVSFADDHQMTAKVVHRGNRQFVTLGDIRAMYAPPAPAGVPLAGGMWHVTYHAGMTAPYTATSAERRVAYENPVALCHAIYVTPTADEYAALLRLADRGDKANA